MTLKQINLYIQKKYPNLELCHTDGYFWFYSPTMKTIPTSIYVPYVYNITKEIIDESLNEIEDDNI